VIVLFGVALMIIGWLGVLFARLIQAAVSRQREFLADSSAVQYTRNPRGIGMALAKIGGLGATVKNAHAEEAGHMMFADGVKRFLGGSFATHPPIANRVERILPGFTAEASKHAGSMTEAVAAIAPPPGAQGFAGSAVTAAAFTANVGDPQPEHVHAARDLIADLPLDLVAATREPARAGAVALGLLLEHEPRARERQLAAIGEGGHALVQQARLFATALADLPHRSRLPLLELAMPALRALPATERAALRRLARALALAYDVITPFEFAILKTIERHVGGEAVVRHGRGPRPTALAQHPQHAAVVISALAWAGADDDGEAAADAFAAGWRALGAGIDSALLPADRCTITALEPSLDALATVSPLGKRNLLEACAAAAAADGIIAPDEIDLLRALAELWECPVPLPATR
ncbi:MAG: M48 family metalloprotease, partial [Planctomycetes bacterium]|nr:M48 family metalloprotease [Planctomycetota bacterium]